MDETRKRIVLVDDHALFRNGLKGLIDGRNGCCVVGEFSDGADFVKALPSMDADAVFMDISMPVMNGDEATAEALRQKPDLKVICLSMLTLGDLQKRSAPCSMTLCANSRIGSLER